MVVIEGVVLSGLDVTENVRILLAMVLGINIGAASVTRLVPLQQERSVRLIVGESSQQNTVFASLQAQTTAPPWGTSIMLNQHRA